MAFVSAFRSPSVVDALSGLAELWNLVMLVVVWATLAWFVYWVFLRKFLRARRIANIRLKRMMSERSSQQTDICRRDH
jgi:hypothetical protein